MRREFRFVLHGGYRLDQSVYLVISIGILVRLAYDLLNYMILFSSQCNCVGDIKLIITLMILSSTGSNQAN